MSGPQTSPFGYGILLAAIFLSPSAAEGQPDLATDNAHWNGTTDLVAFLHSRGTPLEVPESLVVSDLAAEDGVWLLQPAEPGSAQAWLEFLEKGGRVAVASEVAPGAPILQNLGFSVAPGLEVRARRLMGNPHLPVATPGRKHPLTENVPWVVTNHPGRLTHPTLPALLATGGEGVLFVGAVGKGRLIALSDTSLFINNMMAIPAHKQLAENLASYLQQPGGRLFLLTPEATVVDGQAGRPLPQHGRFQRVQRMLALFANASMPFSVQKVLGIGAVLGGSFLVGVLLLRTARYGKLSVLSTPTSFGGLWGQFREEQTSRSRPPLPLFKTEFELELLRRLGLQPPTTLTRVTKALAQKGLEGPALDEFRSLLLTLDATAPEGEDHPPVSRKQFVVYANQAHTLLSALETGAEQDDKAGVGTHE